MRIALNRGGFYMDYCLIFKALGDSTRLEIVKMLSCGEMCACKILEGFEITQPTLSHHMKILCECGLVCARKDGKWSHYSLCADTLKDFQRFVSELKCVKGCEYICG
jgi:ArsR family transcriptional regulator